MIFARGGIVVASGLVAGTLGAVIAGLAVRSQWFCVQLTDAAPWISVLGAMVIAAAISACFPAWRAARIEPSVALRHERRILNFRLAGMVRLAFVETGKVAGHS
jgi:ABC-type antimicrobial peptide transport system permease subunit